MNKRQKRGLVLLAVGMLLVLSSLGIYLAQQQEDAAAGQTAAVLLQQLENRTPSVDVQPQDDNDAPADAQPDSDNYELADPVLPEKKYMGYTLLGSISVPSVGIQLPILDQWSEAMLKIAPCRYTGSISGGNMIIMGHNYKSHFNPLHKVKVGAEVEIENTIGRTFRYRVAKIEYLHRTEGERLPSEEYPLTIFTCRPGGLERIILRCEAA